MEPAPNLALEDREPFYFYTQLLYSHLLHKFSLLLLPVWVSASTQTGGAGGVGFYIAALKRPIVSECIQ